MVRLSLDVHHSPTVAAALADSGYDVIAAATDPVMRRAAAEHHAGLVLTSPRRFQRAGSAYPGNLVAALRALMADPPAAEIDWVHWLRNT